MTGLSDAERDACDVVQALASLAALLRRPPADLPGAAADDPTAADVRRFLLGMAEDAGISAARVLTYLRDQRGAGDGELTAVPPRLGLWRDWVPPRGHVFSVAAGSAHAVDEVPQPRRSDPGE